MNEPPAATPVNRAARAKTWRIILWTWSVAVLIGAFVLARSDDEALYEIFWFSAVVPNLLLGYFAAKAFERRAGNWLPWLLVLHCFATMRLAWLGSVEWPSTDRRSEPGESGIDVFAWFNPLQFGLLFARPVVSVNGTEHRLRFFHGGFIPVAPTESSVVSVAWRHPLFGRHGEAEVLAQIRRGDVMKVSYRPNLLIAFLPARVVVHQEVPTEGQSTTSTFALVVWAFAIAAAVVIVLNLSTGK